MSSIPRRRFQRDAAGIEHHTLTDQSQRRVILVATIPLHHHNLRRADRPLPDAQQCAHAQFGQFVLVQHLDLKPKRLHLVQAVGEFGGGQNIRRFIGQIAGHAHTIGHCVKRGKGSLDLVSLLLWLIVNFPGLVRLLGFVRVEIIAAQNHAQWPDPRS